MGNFISYANPQIYWENTPIIDRPISYEQLEIEIRKVHDDLYQTQKKYRKLQDKSILLGLSLPLMFVLGRRSSAFNKM